MPYFCFCSSIENHFAGTFIVTNESTAQPRAHFSQMTNRFLLSFAKSLLLVVGLCFIFNAKTSAAEVSSQWTNFSNPIYKTAQQKMVLGQRWGISTQNETMQLSFTLDISADFQNGGWYGQIASSSQFKRFKLLLNLSNGKTHKLQYFKATQQGSYPVKQKNGEAIKIYLFKFDIEWDELLKLRNATSILADYTAVDKPKIAQSSKISLAGYAQATDKIVRSVKKNKAAGFYVFSKQELDAVVINDLPKRLQQKQLFTASLEIERSKTKLSSAERGNLSLAQIKSMAQRNYNKIIAQEKRAHQKIYDQEPKWLDMNMCPNTSVKHCRNIGRKGYSKNNLLGMPAINYGKVVGVVWRSKNAIIKIYGGSIEFKIEPKIVRAASAGYYYLFLNKKGNAVSRVHSVDAVAIK